MKIVERTEQMRTDAILMFIKAWNPDEADGADEELMRTYQMATIDSQS